MFAWADDEVMLYLTVADVKKLAKLPGKRDEWAVSEVKPHDKPFEPDDVAVIITFTRVHGHKLSK